VVDPQTASHRQWTVDTGEPPLRSDDHGDAEFRRMFAVFLVVVLAVLFIVMIWPFVQPLLLAAIFSGMLYPVYARLRARLPGDWIASLIVTIAALVVIALPLTFLVGVLTREAIGMTEMAEAWIERQAADGEPISLPGWLPFSEQLQPYREQIVARAGAAVNQMGSFVIDSLSRATQGTLIFVLDLFVMIYAIFFFLIHGRDLLRRLSRSTPLAGDDQASILQRGLAVTRATLKSILVIGALQGFLGGIAFAVVGISSAAFWGVVMALASAIPGVGTALIWLPAAIALVVGGDVTAGLGLAVWGALVVSSIDNLLRPHLIGNDVRMPDLLVLVSTLGGLALFGASGIILGPVLAGIFLTSLHIFAATFRRELAEAAAAPTVIEGPSQDEVEPLP
jgi:predicted PurR-regulated permease PerM